MRISIESRHYIVSAIVAVSLAAIVFLSWYRLDSIAELHTQKEIIHTIGADIRTLHKEHVDFVTLYDPKYLEAFRVTHARLIDEINMIAEERSRLGHDEALITQLSSELLHYKTLFESIAFFQLRIGKDQTEGIRKEMRNSLYAFESVLEGVEDQNIRNAIHRRMLMTQRPEKDLMLRRQEKYLPKFYSFYELTLKDVDTLIVDPKLKLELTTALNKYRENFRELSTAALDIGLTYDDGLRGQAGMAVNDMLKTVDDLVDHMSEEILKKEGEVGAIIIVVGVLFSALIILMIFLLTRSIVKPLKRVTGVMTALADGDYDIDISEDSRADEITAMIRSLKVFKRNAIERDRAREGLQTAHNELEQRVEDRTRELRDANRGLVESQKKAEAANVAKGHFLANMSHELRTPLNAIIGFSDTLQEEIFGKLASDKQKEYVRDINLSGQHLLELINDILDVSAIDAGKLEFHEENIDVGTVIDDAVRLVAAYDGTQDIGISVSVPDSLPRLYGDARRFQQILLNLLSNAVKFSDKSENVSLDVCVEDDGAMTVCVSDKGIGMSNDEIAKAMESFGQVLESSHVSKHQGTGLGLPLVKSLVEMHDGTLVMESEKGVGTVATVTFPPERVIADKLEQGHKAKV